jgi:hypothetical protein
MEFNLLLKRLEFPYPTFIDGEEKLNSSIASKKKSKVKRIGAGGKPTLTIDQETRILNWIQARNDGNLLVSYRLVAEYSNYMYGSMIKFSTGWFAKFKSRHLLSLRRVTSSSHSPSTVELSEQIQKFRENVLNLDPKTVLVNMDETPVSKSFGLNLMNRLINE